MGIDDIELGGIRWPEGATERTGGLSGERRSRGCDEPTVAPDRETVDEGGTVVRADLGCDLVRTSRVEEDGAGVGRSRQGHDRVVECVQPTVEIEGEPGVIGALGPVP